MKSGNTATSSVSGNRRCRQLKCPLFGKSTFFAFFGLTKISGYFLAIKKASEAPTGSLQTNKGMY